MEIRARSHSSPLLLTAALTLLALGLGLSFLTWQNLRQQRRNVFEHLQLSSSVILRGVEANLLREMRGHMGGQGRGPRRGSGMGRGPGMGLGGNHGNDPGLAPGPIRLQARDLFMDLAATREVAFLALYAPDRTLMVSSAENAADPVAVLPESAWEGIRLGQWQALMSASGRDVFVAAARVRPGLSALCLPGETLNDDIPDGIPNGPPDGMPGPAPGCAPEAPGFPVLVVGLDATGHVTQFNNYRRTAVLQTGYVLLATGLLAALGLAYLRRREQGRAFQRLESFHSRLLDTMPDGLLTVDGHGVIRAANPAAEQLLAASGPKGQAGSTSLVGLDWNSLPLSRAADGAADGAAGPGQDGRDWSRHDYAGRSLEVLSMPIPRLGEDSDAADTDDPGPDERLVLVRDRTDIKSLEKGLEEAERLAAIGRLAAGLAHEIRNPLSSLRGFAQYFAGKLAGRDPEEEYARTMVREADRVDKVVTDLLFLARPRQVEPASVDLAVLAKELGGLLRLDLEERGAILETDLAEAGLRADPDLLKQALLNLMLNALAALPATGGVIRLGSRRLGDAVEVAVTDNGHGMPDQDRAHALEPFFTTRRQGTGLGLAIVHKIMRDHNGSVHIESATAGPGQGVTVRLVFPGEDRP